jgi:Fe-S cluster assembly ATP-binding protein
MLTLKNFRVTVDQKPIVKGIDLSVKPGELHVLMGPNGSGKSTLAYALAGHPHYHVPTASKATLIRRQLLKLSPDDRARAGLFLAFQYPVTLEGVSVQNFLKTAYDHLHCYNCKEGDEVGDCGRLSIKQFRQLLTDTAKSLDIKPELLSRSLNDGFSGGEKKRLEILQLQILKPKFAILDETDSGLDIDSIKVISHGINATINDHGTGILLITHYRRILKHLQPNHVHIMVKGKLVASDGPKLLTTIDKSGYSSFTK